MDADREEKIRQQDDRNRRAGRVKRKNREKVAKDAKAVFRCKPCGRSVGVRWETLGQGGGGPPKCNVCGSVMALTTACLTKGLLPRENQYGGRRKP